jgi:hypothetical protein
VTARKEVNKQLGGPHLAVYKALTESYTRVCIVGHLLHTDLAGVWNLHQLVKSAQMQAMRGACAFLCNMQHPLLCAFRWLPNINPHKPPSIESIRRSHPNQSLSEACVPC